MSYFNTAPLPLVVSENGNAYDSQKEITCVNEFSSSSGTLYKLEVRAKDWKIISSTERYAEVTISEIEDSVIKQGLVIIYISESERTVSLPFTYYQSKRAVFFQPSYEIGHAYITLLGEFILNPQIAYTFKILVVNSKALKKHKKINWHNFNQALKAVQS